MRGQGDGRIYSLGDPFVIASEQHYDLLPANANLTYGIASIGLYDPLGSPAYRQLLEPLGAVNLSAGIVQPTRQALAENRRLLDLLGVTVVLSREPIEGFVLVRRVGDAYVYRNPSAFPRAWVVGSLREVAPGPNDARDPVALLLSPEVDLRRVALGAGASQPIDGVPGPAEVVRDDGDEVVVEANGPGVLVLSDRWAPGWRATVDGVDEPVLEVDVLLRGVRLNAGHHQIRFRYWPAGFSQGILIGIGSALATLGLLGYLHYVTRRGLVGPRRQRTDRGTRGEIATAHRRP